MRGSYNVTVVQCITPTSLPSSSQKKYQLLIITESQAALSDCCHISVTGSALSNVRPVMWLFSSKLSDPLRPS